MPFTLFAQSKKATVFQSRFTFVFVFIVWGVGGSKCQRLGSDMENYTVQICGQNKLKREQNESQKVNGSDTRLRKLLVLSKSCGELTYGNQCCNLGQLGLI